MRLLVCFYALLITLWLIPVSLAIWRVAIPCIFLISLRIASLSDYFIACILQGQVDCPTILQSKFYAVLNILNYFYCLLLYLRELMKCQAGRVCGL